MSYDDPHQAVAPSTTAGRLIMGLKDSATDESVAQFNEQLDAYLQGIALMGIKQWKAVKSLIFAILVAALSAFAIMQGADPTTTATLALMILGVLGGVEFSELLAVKGIQIVRDEPKRDDNGTERDR